MEFESFAKIKDTKGLGTKTKDQSFWVNKNK